MAKGYFLTEADRQTLRRINSELKKLGVGGNGLPERGLPNQAADTYIAQVPAGGIPPLVRGSPDVPGSVSCDIYKIDEGVGTGSTAELAAVPGLTKTIYNLSTTRINSRYVIVSKTKDGRWVTDDTDGTEDGTGTGTGTDCVSVLAGVDLNTLPEETSPSYALGLDSNGCLVKIPVADC